MAELDQLENIVDSIAEWSQEWTQVTRPRFAILALPLMCRGQLPSQNEKNELHDINIL